MNIDDLKKEVFEANLKLVEYGLVTLTWGNVSGIDREKNLFVIKPSGVDYSKMQWQDMPVLDMDGKKIDGELNPSSDTPTHLELYKAFKEIGGIAHTHSLKATSFAQAKKEIICMGTTHADHFFESIPVTRDLTESEVNENYEKHTGTVIIETFHDKNPLEIPGVLVASHAPFAWGINAMESVKHSLIMEKVAEMAIDTLSLNPNTNSIKDYILNKHYLRKHGKDAYYGQIKK